MSKKKALSQGRSEVDFSNEAWLVSKQHRRHGQPMNVWRFSSNLLLRCQAREQPSSPPAGETDSAVMIARPGNEGRRKNPEGKTKQKGKKHFFSISIEEKLRILIAIYLTSSERPRSHRSGLASVFCRWNPVGHKNRKCSVSRDFRSRVGGILPSIRREMPTTGFLLIRLTYEARGGE